MQELAKSRGGKCLSKSYVNARSKLKWQCADGHVFQSATTDVKSGKWCPTCFSSIGENLCRYYFETLFDEKFIRSRPKWLVNSKGRRLELDGYCEKLKLAFEYQGSQHYRQHKFFHIKRSLAMQKQDDNFKAKICQKYGVDLIVVPYLLNHKNMKEYIIRSCKKKRINIPKNPSLIECRPFNFYPQKLKELQNIAASKGGKCRSSNYLGVHTKLHWECKEHHRWYATPAHVTNGKWCPECAIMKNAAKQRLTIEDMQKLAEEKDGKCISKSYINARTKLKWQCAQGHVWGAIPDVIKNRGSWCPYCSHRARSTIDEMQQESLSKQVT